jgi:hypothetical protein
LSALHFEQRFASGDPQSPQDFWPSGFSELHFEQSTKLARFPKKVPRVSRDSSLYGKRAEDH